MEVVGVRILFTPRVALLTVAFIGCGLFLGTCSGLIPGLHVNALALLLAAAAPTVPGPPHLIAATMLAAAVVHSFLDVIPSLTLGVPDAAMAVSALPGHRLVADGRGREALRLSAIGSGGAVLIAIPLAIPVTYVMGHVYPIIARYLPIVLGVVVLVLLATEHGHRARLGGALSIIASGTLGVLTLSRTPGGLLPTGDLLMPLFAGLFGAPVLLDALAGSGVPIQADRAIRVSKSHVGGATLAGTVAGGIVGFVPGVSSAIAATMALAALPERTGARGFVVATSGVNTANAVFALLALVTLGTPRTGVMVAVEQAKLPLDLPLLLMTIVIAAAVGAVFVLLLGDAYLKIIGRLNHTRLCIGVLALLIVLAIVFAGGIGLAAFLGATLVGLLPPRFGARRVHLMGVLMIPIVV